MSVDRGGIKLGPSMRGLGCFSSAWRHPDVRATFSHPFHIARTVASLDHLSGGRAARNVVTSFQDDEAQNFGEDRLPNKALRYERPRESVEVAAGLWASWAADAFVRNKETGAYFDPDKVQVLQHSGKHFRVRGPLNLSRTPQGRPIIIQAGACPSRGRCIAPGPPPAPRRWRPADAASEPEGHARSASPWSACRPASRTVPCRPDVPAPAVPAHGDRLGLPGTPVRRRPPPRPSRAFRDRC